MLLGSNPMKTLQWGRQIWTHSRGRQFRESGFYKGLTLFNVDQLCKASPAIPKHAYKFGCYHWSSDLLPLPFQPRYTKINCIFHQVVRMCNVKSKF